MVQFPPVYFSPVYGTVFKKSELFSPVIIETRMQFYTLEVNTLNTIGTYGV